MASQCPAFALCWPSMRAVTPDALISNHRQRAISGSQNEVVRSGQMAGRARVVAASTLRHLTYQRTIEQFPV